MAQYITTDNLARYDTLVKQYVDQKTAKCVKAIIYDEQTNTLSFYRVTEPIPAGEQPVKTVTISSSADVAELRTLIGEIPSESGTPVAQSVIGYVDLKAGHASQLATVSMTVPQDADAGYWKTHVIYQGTGANKTEIGRINIPFDTVVSGGTVVTATAVNPITVEGIEYTEGQFLKLVIQNDSNPVYIPVSSLGIAYVNGDGVSIANNTISLEIDSTNANGLEVTASGLKLNLAVASDPENGITGSAGAISASEKAVLNSFSLASEQQIRGLFD